MLSIEVQTFEKMSDNTSETKRAKMKEARKKFNIACDQLQVMNNKLGDLQARYRRAKKSEQRTFGYQLRLRLMVIEGLRKMYYDYARNRAMDISKLRAQQTGRSTEESDMDTSNTPMPSTSLDQQPAVDEM